MENDTDLPFYPITSFCPVQVLKRGWLYIKISHNNINNPRIYKRYIKLERGFLKDETTHRLAIFKVKPIFQSKPYREVTLEKSSLTGLVNGTETTKLAFRLSGKFPTISLVQDNVSTVLLFGKNDLEKRLSQHDAWYNAMMGALNFEGYWSIQDVKSTDSSNSSGGSNGSSSSGRDCSLVQSTQTASSIILCCMQSKLTILNHRGNNEYETLSCYDLQQLVSVQRQEKFEDGQTMLLTLTFQYSPASVKDLSFKIKRDSNISRDLCKILDKQRKPDFRRTRSRRFIPSYLDVEPGSKYYKSFVQRCYVESKIDKRKCFDDMVVNETPPPILPPCRNDPQDPLMSLYDLNILSSRNSVKDAIHYYENLHGGYTVQPLRNPPDVVRQRLRPISAADEEEYWGIASTLCEVLRRKKPLPDTLGLSKHVRIKLCFYLLDDQLNSWKDLSEHLGLTQDAVRMIETLFQSNMLINMGSCPDVVTPPECVLRHWQFIHNQHENGNSTAPVHPCTKQRLVALMKSMERFDLVELLENDVTRVTQLNCNSTMIYSRSDSRCSANDQDSVQHADRHRGVVPGCCDASRMQPSSLAVRTQPAQPNYNSMTLAALPHRHPTTFLVPPFCSPTATL